MCSSGRADSHASSSVSARTELKLRTASKGNESRHALRLLQQLVTTWPARAREPLLYMQHPDNLNLNLNLILTWPARAREPLLYVQHPAQRAAFRGKQFTTRPALLGRTPNTYFEKQHVCVSEARKAATVFVSTFRGGLHSCCAWALGLLVLHCRS